MPTADYAESFYLLQREFVDAILSGRPFTQTLAENVRTLAATFSGYESTRNAAGQPSA